MLSRLVSKTSDSLSTLCQKVLRSKVQYFFLAILLIFLPFLLIFLQEFDNIVKMRKKGNKNYSWPQYSDLYKAILTTLSLILLNLIFFKAFSPVANLIVKKSYKGKERLFRIEKFVDCTFKGSYYIIAVIFAYFVSKDSYFLPVTLGGKGSANKMFYNYPYQEATDFGPIREYLMMQLGYHMFSLVQHLYKEPKNDFIEMLLHHIITVSLISLAYFMNYVCTSILVLIVHDFSDIFGYLVRIFVDTEYKNWTLFWYLSLLATWFYMRLFVFPFELIRFAVYDNELKHEIYGLGIMGAMLHILLFLHAYWFWLFIKMGLKFLVTKTPEDTYHVQ